MLKLIEVNELPDKMKTKERRGQINKILDQFIEGDMKIAKVDYDILDYTQPLTLYNHLRIMVRKRHIGNVYVALRFAEVYLVKKT
jgi:hypothetical protein